MKRNPNFKKQKELLKEKLREDFPEFAPSELYISVSGNGWEVPVYVSVYNSLHSLDKKVRWLNKVTISCYPRVTVLRHRARTDARFLSPFDERVRAAVEKRIREIFT